MMRAYHDEDEDFDEEEDVEERTSQIVGDLDVNMEDMYGEYDESGQGDDDDDEDNDEEEEEGEDSDDEEDEDDTEDAGGEEDDEMEDADMVNGDEAPPTSPPESTSPSILPPHLARRNLLVPSFALSRPPLSLSIEAVCAIPLPSPVHSLASTQCMSYLLTGSQEGYVRAYDFWSSVNGGQLMTAQQRSAVGFGEGISKAGVARGWWENEVVGLDGEPRAEPVYSMSVESDGLWALTGTRSGQINLYTLRHSPGHFITSLKGHSSVVSCMTLLPAEQGFISGGWDGTVREWDLNTGQTVQTWPTHGAQISSLSLQPLNPSSTTTNGQTNGLDISVRVGEDFFDAREELPPSSPPASSTPRAQPSSPPDKPDGSGIGPNGTTPVVRDSSAIEPATTTATDAPSPYDPLFDDDAEGEEVPPSDAILGDTPGINDMAPPSPPRAKPGAALALPGKLDRVTIPSSTPSLFPQSQAGPSRLNVESAAAGIPVLSPTDYRGFSNNVLMYSSMDGQVTLVDRRVADSGDAESRRGVGRLVASDKAPPWCMSACWSAHGTQILAGRRNGTIDVWDVRKSSASPTPLRSPALLRTLKTPAESGPVSCIVPFPDGRHVATASNDNVRLWSTTDYFDVEEEGRKKGGRPPFKIIAGHHGGTISSMIVDPTCRFMITASGDRGWQGESTKVVLIHEVKW